MHNRRSIRLRGFDYGQRGAYYVSIGTAAARPLFGSTVGNRIRLSELGQLVDRLWQTLPEHYPGLRLDLHQVMPTHFHGILMIIQPGQSRQCEAFGAPTRQTLPTMIRGFKAACTREWRRGPGRPDDVIWQGRFLERVIRSRRELSSMRALVGDNVLWHRLCDRDTW